MANLKNAPMFAVHNDYYTPKYAWENINHLIPKTKIVWECCILNSHRSDSKQHLTDLGNIVVGDTDWDYFEHYDKLEYDLIVTNIPFETNLKQRLLHTMLANGKPFITILNSMNVFANWFNDVFKEHRADLQVIYPRGKLHFEKLKEDGTTEYCKGTSFYCVYVCYKMNIPNDLLYLD
tara:strand:+ start:579 stop:1112 length:534 start_codon:yes stop_codon:yes gene_type:complete